MIEIARQRSHGAKVFLIGHSLGGLIALDYAEKSGEKLAGLIVSSPGLRLKMKVSPVKALLAKMLSGVAPSPTIKTGLDSNLISRDREVVRKYVNDPLVHGVVTPRWTTEFLAAEEETIRDAQRLKLPCLILQAGADGLVDPSATIDFFKKVGASDKTLKVYDGFYHEILNEPGKDSVLQEIDAWLSARV
jgi:lysophospholipase